MLAEAPIGVAAERCAAQEAKIEQVRVHSQLRRDNGQYGQHGRHIRDVVHERGDQDGTPHNNGVEEEQAAASVLDDRISEVHDNACFCDTADDDEKAKEKEECLEVNVLNGALYVLLFVISHIIEDGCDNAQLTSGVLGMKDAVMRAATIRMSMKVGT